MILYAIIIFPQRYSPTCICEYRLLREDSNLADGDRQIVDASGHLHDAAFLFWLLRITSALLP